MENWFAPYTQENAMANPGFPGWAALTAEGVR